MIGATGNEVIQFPDVDLRGRIVDLINSSTGTYEPPPTDPITTKFLFLDNTALMLLLQIIQLIFKHVKMNTANLV